MINSFSYGCLSRFLECVKSIFILNKLRSTAICCPIHLLLNILVRENIPLLIARVEVEWTYCFALFSDFKLNKTFYGWPTEIRCLKMASRERFSAVLSMPEGLLGSNPIFEDKPAIDPITSRICQIQPASRPGTFQLEVTNLDACGVKSCNQNGEVIMRYFRCY